MTPNKTYAAEWLEIAKHDLGSAEILLEADHFTDSIGRDCQQAIEKLLKALLAFDNKKIPKSHNLVELSLLVEERLTFTEEEQDILDIATRYYLTDRYPNPNYTLPPQNEVKEVLEFAKELYARGTKLIEESE